MAARRVGIGHAAIAGLAVLAMAAVVVLSGKTGPASLETYTYTAEVPTGPAPEKVYTYGTSVLGRRGKIKDQTPAGGGEFVSINLVSRSLSRSLSRFLLTLGGGEFLTINK
jgi:hypothetical protein